MHRLIFIYVSLCPKLAEANSSQWQLIFTSGLGKSGKPAMGRARANDTHRQNQWQAEPTDSSSVLFLLLAEFYTSKTKTKEKKADRQGPPSGPLVNGKG